MNVSKNVTSSRSFTHDHTYFRLVPHTYQFCISCCQLLILFIQFPNQRTELHILSLQHPNFLIAALWILGKKLHIPSQFGTICEHLFTIVLTNISMPHLKAPSQNIDNKTFYNHCSQEYNLQKYFHTAMQLPFLKISATISALSDIG